MTKELQTYTQLTELEKKGVRVPLFPITPFLNSFIGETTYSTPKEVVGARYILSRFAGQSTFWDFIRRGPFGSYEEYNNQPKWERYLASKVNGIQFLNEFTRRMLYLAQMKMYENGVIRGGKGAENEVNFDRISHFTQTKGIAKVVLTNNGDYLQLTEGGKLLVDQIQQHSGSTLVNPVQRGSAFMLQALWDSRNQEYSNGSAIAIAADYNSMAKDNKGSDFLLQEEFVHSFRAYANCIDSDGQFVTGFTPEKAGVDSNIYRRVCMRCPLLSKCGTVVSNLHDMYRGDQMQNTAKTIDPHLTIIRNSLFAEV